MAKVKTKYICNVCGYETVKWLGKCPDCGNFSTFEESVTTEGSRGSIQGQGTGRAVKPQPLNHITPLENERTTTGLAELDRVLGGGIVQGSLVLVGGDPGIGKSTLLLQICNALGDTGKNVLYVSGEESPQQIKMRADRLGITTDRLSILSETSFNIAEATIATERPDLVIIDSIQTMYIEDIPSAPGSVTQVRETTSRIMHIGKRDNISVIIVGHVTKEGALAGPRMLEHMVDTVLYFEGDKRASYRILRAVKNRFGSTNEIGVFEMRENGLREIDNPSEFMLTGRAENVAGSVVTCSMEGTRPLLIEVQSLVAYTSFGMPRRMSTGMDYNRVVLLIAVLEKRANMQLSSYDVYVNLTGGIRVAEPSLDAAVLLAIASAYTNRYADKGLIAFGEVGLTGELRAVSMAEKRVSEAAKLGFECCIVPQANLKEASRVKGIKVLGAQSVEQLIDLAL
jgi:DNA repair protein RadA/Sms